LHPIKNAHFSCLAGLIKLRELVRSPGNRDVEVHLRQADPDSYRAVLKEIKSKDIHSMVVDTRPEHMHLFLRGVSAMHHLFSGRPK
jgi:ionotropic kainate glutamate receptor 2